MTTNEKRARGSVRAVARSLFAGCGATLALAAAPAGAQVICGDTIGPNQHVVLQADLACDDVETALVVQGPAVLDLNGFAILCDDANGDGREVIAGVLIEGTGATVRNGAIRGCRSGVTAGGAGKHRVSDVSVFFASAVAIRTTSERNKISNSFSLFPSGTGFEVEGEGNVLTGNAATGGRIGFDVAGRSTLKKNIASGSERIGFEIRSSRSVLTDNRAIGALTAFEIRGDANRLLRNQADDNSTGFFLESFAEANVLTRCSATDSALNGFAVAGDGNRLQRSRAEDNGGNGIRLASTASGNVVTGSVARGNELDLFDGTPGCGTNLWRRNGFGSSNDACIR